MPERGYIQPMAIAAGIGTVGLIVYLMHKRHVECTEFPDIYSGHGPIHLTTDASDDVRQFIAMRIEDARTAGVDPTEHDLQKQAAEYLAPDCDWSELPTVKAQEIWASIGTIVHYMKTQEALG